MAFSITSIDLNIIKYILHGFIVIMATTGLLVSDGRTNSILQYC